MAETPLASMHLEAMALTTHRIRKLKQLGVRPEEAYSHGNSRKGPWRMAKSLAISMAMPNEWLDDLGLFSLSKRWTELAPLRRTAQSQSTRADPHARWCGKVPQQCGPYPDRMVRWLCIRCTLAPACNH